MAHQRVRDPLHDLIEFSNSELERTLWKVVETRPFQRLRRVKQLGFSDLVYPGACHSRFAHSLGVFHTARQLMEIVRRGGRDRNPSKEDRALAAALVHDLGHGPFSHAFEDVGKRLNLKFANHETMSDALIRDSEVTVALNEVGTGFAIDVADIIKKDGVKSIEHAVVSSQFDADRLDYMRRDRLMTGTRHAQIDFPWLVANLEIGSVPVGIDDQQTGTIDTFVLGPKAIQAAEAFVLGLFQLYPTVYFHKATRGAEKIFAELMVRTVTLILDGSVALTGLPERHPLVQFAKNPDSIESALLLDDSVVWGALSQMCDAEDTIIADFSRRIRDRKLYKCFDIRVKVTHSLDAKSDNSDEIVSNIDRCCESIEGKIFDWVKNNDDEVARVLLDKDKRSPYKSINESKGPLDRINVRTAGGSLIDLKEQSSVVSALKTYKLFRTYANRDDLEAQEVIERIVQEEIDKCKPQ